MFSNESLKEGMVTMGQQHVKLENPEDREKIEQELKDPLA